jgi:hypothetical protein
LKASKNKLLRKMFRLKKNKLHGRGRKLHTEEINNLYISFTVAWMIKLERDRLDA